MLVPSFVLIATAALSWAWALGGFTAANVSPHKTAARMSETRLMRSPFVTA
jgi:hypothetical protein